MDTDIKAATDRIIFRTEASSRMFGWNGPWPPPQQMAIVTAPSGRGVVCELAEQRPDEMVAIEASEGWSVERFALRSASEIPEPAPPGSGWFRGAEYLPES